MMTALFVAAAAIVVLVALANRIGVSYPIALVLGGIAIGFIPGVPTAPLPPDLVLVVFLPPLLYWESVTAPTSEFRAAFLRIFQLAFGLVIVTAAIVAVVAHAIVPAMGWGVAFVLGAIVSSTDEVAFSPIAERLRVPRHVIASIEGESLINDATSLTLYAGGIAAIVGGSFSFGGSLRELAISIVAAVAIGLAVGFAAVGAWRLVQDGLLQSVISVMAPYAAYLPAHYLGVSGVLAVVTTGLLVNRYTPTILQPSARARMGDFWVTIVFLVNAFIFVQVGIRFRAIVAVLGQYSPWELLWYGIAISLTVVIVRIAWLYANAALPAFGSAPSHPGGADWGHVAIIAWSGMRGGVSLAAALAIPLETSAGPFPDRDLIIFLTFCVLLVTLVGQGGTLPALIRRLGVTEDDADDREEQLAIDSVRETGMAFLNDLRRRGGVSSEAIETMRRRCQALWTRPIDDNSARSQLPSQRAHHMECAMLDAQRLAIVDLRDRGRIDSTVMRRIERLLDLETEQVELLAATSAGLGTDINPQPTDEA